MSLPYTQTLVDVFRPPRSQVSEVAMGFLNALDAMGGAVGAGHAHRTIGLPGLQALLADHYLLHLPSPLGGIMILGPAGLAHLDPRRRYRVKSTSEAADLVYRQEVVRWLEDQGFSHDTALGKARHLIYDLDGRLHVLVGKCIGMGLSPRTVRDQLAHHRSWLLSENAALLVATPNLSRLKAVRQRNEQMVTLVKFDPPSDFTSLRPTS